jgi:hypothetical protein
MQISRGLEFERNTLDTDNSHVGNGFSQENGRVIVQSGQSDLSVIISARNFVFCYVVETGSELAETRPGHFFRN